jgi:hypothetical protein
MPELCRLCAVTYPRPVRVPPGVGCEHCGLVLCSGHQSTHLDGITWPPLPWDPDRPPGRPRKPRLPKPPRPDQELLTVGEVASLLEISVRKAERLTNAGWLSVSLHTVGGLRRYSREQVIAEYAVYLDRVEAAS